MVRFNDKPQITTAELTGTDILPITDVEDSTSDKKVSISQLSTYFGDNITTFATKDLTNTGMLADAIISAPNGVIVAGSNNTSIIVKNGLQILFSNGRTSDKRFNTISYTVSSDITQNIATLADDTYELFINNSGTIIYTPLDNVRISRNTPTVTTTVAYWYDVISNYWKYTSNMGSTWSNVTINALGQFTVVSGVLTNITPNTVTYIPNPEAIMIRDLSNITESGEDIIKDLVGECKISDLIDDTATNPIDKADTLTGLTASVAELNTLDGITATTAELNTLDGITATTTELNYVDGVTSNVQTQCDNKLNKQQITNCILEDPQNINLTLSNGTLTLKAGSVVVVPNGFESDGTTPKFDEVTIANDISTSGSSSDTNLRELVYNPNGTVAAYMTTESGTTGYSGSGNCLYYNTSTNKVSIYLSGVLTYTDCSLPLGVVKADGTNICGSITTVFQSIGYIGTCFFFRDGLKVLICNGKNSDGTLKNIEHTVSTDTSYSFASAALTYTGYVFLHSDNTLSYMAESVTFIVDTLPSSGTQAAFYIVKSENKMYFLPSAGSAFRERNGCLIAKCYSDGTNWTSVKIYQPIDLLKQSDSSQISSWGMPSSKSITLTLGASGSTYTAPANGYFIVEYTMSGSTWLDCRNITINFGIYNTYSTATADGVLAYCPMRKGDICRMNYQSVSNAVFRFIYAEGEV